MSDTAAAARLPVTALVGVSLALSGVTYASTLPYGGIVAIDNLHISNANYAWIMTASALVSVLASVLLGWLSDKIHDRRLLVILTALAGALGYGLIWLWRDVAAYIIAYCLIMPLGNALYSQSFSFARAWLDRSKPSNIEFIITVLRSIFAISWVIIPPIAGWIAATYAVFDVYGVAAAAFLAAAAIFGFMLSDPGTRIGVARNEAAAEPAGRISRAMIVGIAGVTIINTGVMVIITAGPLAFISNYHGTLADVGVIASFAALLEIPFMLAWGYAAKRFRKPTLIVAGTLVYALYLVLMLQVHDINGVLWVQVFNAIGMAALVSIPISYLQEAIKGRVGLSTSLLDVVGVASRLGGAAIFAVASSEGEYLALFAIAAALCVIGAAVMLVAHNVVERPVAATAR